jgi:hypothetical protein
MSISSLEHGRYDKPATDERAQRAARVKAGVGFERPAGCAADRVAGAQGLAKRERRKIQTGHSERSA